jgi:hypothetical protein
MNIPFARQQAIAEDSPDVLKAGILDKLFLAGHQHFTDELRPVQKEYRASSNTEGDDISILLSHSLQKPQRIRGKGKQMPEGRSGRRTRRQRHRIALN